MKRKLLSVSFLMLASSVIFAQENTYVPPVYEQGKSFFYSENFEYEPGGTIPEKSGNKWRLKDKGTAPKIIAGNLIHPSFDETFNPGNQLELVNNNLRGLASTLFLEPGQMVDGDLYVSFLMNVSDAKIANQTVEGTPDFVEGGEKFDPFFQFNRIEDAAIGLKGGSNGQLFAKAASQGKYKLGVTRFGLNKSTPNAIYTEEELSYGTTYHILLKMSYSTTQTSETEMERKESISLFIDPSLDEEPVSAAAKKESVIANKVASAISSVHFLQNAFSPSAIVDGIRIANSWENLGIAKPNSTGKVNIETALTYIQNGNSLILKNLYPGSTLSVFDLTGKVIHQMNDVSDTEEINGLKSGIYLVKNQSEVLKVRIR